MLTRFKVFLAIPLIAALTAPALDVTDFGAIPDDNRDDTPAFLAAFNAALSKADKHLIIPKGKYHLRATGNPERPDTLFPAENIEGLTIEGRDAELILSGIGAVFSFLQCQGITVKGLTVDWDRVPFSEGTVVATNPRHFDIRILDAYPVKGDEPVGAFMTYHPDTRLPDGRDLDVYDGVERTELIAPQVLRVHLRRDISVPVGKLLVLRHQVYGPGPFVFQRCSEVTVSDTTVYSAPGMGLVSVVCTNVTLKRFKVCLRPDSGRLISATADATHFAGCKGTVTLQDCLFEGMGDDGANIKSGLYLLVRQRLDEHTVLGQHNLKMNDLPDPGDTLELAHVDTLSSFASGTVRAASIEPGNEHLHRITFAESLPKELHEGDVLGNASRVPKLRMRGCTVRSNRARGVLCQTRDAIIEDCVFQNCTSAGVLVLTEAVHFFESIGTRNILVRHNRFENCNQGAAGAEGALCAVAYLKDFAYPSKPGVHRDVSFEENFLVNTPESAIFAVGVDGLKMTGNTIEKVCLDPHRVNGRNAIQIQDCARVILERNHIDPQRQGSGMTQAIHIEPASSAIVRP